MRNWEGFLSQILFICLCRVSGGSCYLWWNEDVFKSISLMSKCNKSHQLFWGIFKTHTRTKNQAQRQYLTVSARKLCMKGTDVPLLHACLRHDTFSDEGMKLFFSITWPHKRSARVNGVHEHVWSRGQKKSRCFYRRSGIYALWTNMPGVAPHRKCYASLPGIRFLL